LSDRLPQQPDASEGAVRRRRARPKNLALAAALLAFVVLFYFVTLVRMGGS